MIDHILDLNNRHFTYHRGQFTMIGTWVRLEEGIEPCICLVRRGAEAHELQPCVIPVDSGWQWEIDRGDPRHCAEMSIEFLKSMNLEVTRENMMALVSFIHDNIGELYSIPPSRQLDADREAIAEAVVTVNGSKKEVLI